MSGLSNSIEAILLNPEPGYENILSLLDIMKKSVIVSSNAFILSPVYNKSPI